MSDPKHDERHETVWLLLPWYANGTLETAERLLVEDHVAGCASCHEEVARCNGLAAALRSRPEIAPSPHPLQLARLMERLDAPDAADATDAVNAFAESDAADGIDATDATDAIGATGAVNAVNASGATHAIDAIDAIDASAAAEARHAAVGPARARIPPRGGSQLGGTPRRVPGALAGQLAALIQLATAQAIGPARRQPALYRTLSEPSAQAVSPAGTAATSATAAAPQIRVVFVEAATAKQMREVLLSTRGHLVDGPSPLGAYTLELPAPAPAVAALPAGGTAAGTGDLALAPPAPRASPREAAPDSVGIVLAYLRSQPIVRFAEPVAGTGAPAPTASPQGVPGTTPEAPPS